MTLYDFEKDGEIAYGKTLIKFEDGSTKLVSTKLLERSQDEQFEPRGTKRSRPVRSIKHRKEHIRRTAQKQGIPLRKIKSTKQSLP